MKKRILFICDDGTHRSLMAASLAEKIWGSSELSIEAAALEVNPPHPSLQKTLERYQVSLRGGPVKPLRDFDVNEFDVVITLSGLAEEGTPEPHRKTLKFFWSLPNAVSFRGSQALVDEMFDRIYIELEGNIKEITKYILST